MMVKLLEFIVYVVLHQDIYQKIIANTSLVPPDLSYILQNLIYMVAVLTMKSVNYIPRKLPKYGM